MIDLLALLAQVHRSVAQDPTPDEIVRVTLRRSYPTDPADLWDALTRPERLARWFSPVSGDLRRGGTFQIENNAAGDILACEPPKLLRTTFGDASSIVTLTLAPAGEDTELTLDHTVPLAIAGSVAGALFAGPGWDEAFSGLWLHGSPGRRSRSHAGHRRGPGLGAPGGADLGRRRRFGRVAGRSARGRSAGRPGPVRPAVLAGEPS